jgi:phosphoglycolate phosphatase
LIYNGFHPYRTFIARSPPSEMLSTLQKSRRRLFIATSKPTVYATRIIDHFEMDIYFERVFGSELDGTRVDNSELLHHALSPP